MKNWKEKFKLKYEKEEFPTDSYIEDFADDHNLSYNEVFEYYNTLKKSPRPYCLECKHSNKYPDLYPCSECFFSKKSYFEYKG